jgi:hypothetical protein
MSWEKLVKQVSITIEKSISNLFDATHQLTRGIIPSAQQVNEITKKHLGFKVFAYAPSSYDTPQELAKQTKQMINLGFSSYAIDFVKELKKRGDVNALQDVANFLSKKIQNAIAKRKFEQVVYLSAVAEQLDPNFRKNLKKYLSATKENGELLYEAIEKARGKINEVEHATMILNLTALGVGVGSILARPFLTPMLRLFADTITAGTLVGSVIGEVKRAELQGRNPLTALLDLPNLAVAYDLFRSIRTAPTLLKGTTAKLILNKPTEELIPEIIADMTPSFKTKLQITRDLEEVKTALTFINKSLGVGENIKDSILQAFYKHAGTKSAVAFHRMVSAYLHDTKLASEFSAVARYIYNKENVKEALKRYLREDGSIKVNAGEVERILFELSKQDQEIYNYLVLQRITSLMHAINRAIDDGAEVIHVRRPGSKEIILSFNPLETKVDEIIKPIFDELDKGNTLTLTWLNKKENVPAYMILKPAYHPSYDNFIILRAEPLVVATKEGKTIDELLPELKKFFSDDEIEQLRKIVGDRKILLLEDEYFSVPYHNISSSKEFINSALRVRLKQNLKIDDDNVEFLYGKFTIYPNATLFPHKLEKIAENLEELKGVLENELRAKITKVIETANELDDKTVQKIMKALLEAEDVETELTKIARQIEELAFKQAPEMHREGKGFAILFRDYNSLVDYASSKVWSRLYPNLAGVRSLRTLREFLERVENKTDMQKIVLDFIKTLEGKTGNELMDALKTFNRYIGSVYTMWNIPITVANYGQYLAIASTLFPSLNLFSRGSLKHLIEELKVAYREAGVRHGLYKYHALNPFVPLVQGLIRSSIKATIDDEVGFKAVIDDLARLITKFNQKDAEVVAKELYDFYKLNKELLVDDLERMIIGGDLRTLNTLFVRFGPVSANTLEAVISWYRFIFSPLSLGLQATHKFFTDLSRGDVRALGKGLAFSSLLAFTVGTQAVPYFAPAEIGYSLAKDVANIIAKTLGVETPEILDEKNLGYAISKRVLSDFNIEVLDPKSKYYLFEASGREVAKYLAGQELVGDERAWNIVAIGLDILRMLANVSEAGLVSPSAMSYDLTLFSPIIELGKNLVKELWSVERGDKTYGDILARVLPNLIPAGRRMLALIEGKPLVKTNYGELREFYGVGKELSEKDFYTTIGLSWYLGYLATFYDGVFTNFFFDSLANWFDIEPEKFKRPKEAEYYRVINLRDTKQLQDANQLKYMIAMFKHADDEGKRFILDRMHRLVENSLLSRSKNLETILKHFEADFEKKEQILKNYVEFYNFARQYLTPESRAYLDQRVKLLIDIYRIAKQRRGEEE